MEEEESVTAPDGDVIAGKETEAHKRDEGAAGAWGNHFIDPGGYGGEKSKGSKQTKK